MAIFAVSSLVAMPLLEELAELLLMRLATVLTGAGLSLRLRLHLSFSCAPILALALSFSPLLPTAGRHSLCYHSSASSSSGFLGTSSLQPFRVMIIWTILRVAAFTVVPRLVADATAGATLRIATILLTLSPRVTTLALTWPNATFKGCELGRLLSETLREFGNLLFERGGGRSPGPPLLARTIRLRDAR